ncbi:thiol-disulfide oxidoreductase DCC, partial [Leptospira borgpetersenii]
MLNSSRLASVVARQDLGCIIKFGIRLTEILKRSKQKMESEILD